MDAHIKGTRQEYDLRGWDIIVDAHFKGTRLRQKEEGYKESVFKDKVGQGAGRQVQEQQELRSNDIVVDAHNEGTRQEQVL